MEKDILLYKLPTMEDGVSVVEEFYCVVLNKYRNGEALDQELIDWMDNANNWLQMI